MTKIKTYKGFEIRFDTFDNKFYILCENERIAKDKIENLEKSIDNILKAKFTKIPILVKVSGFENNGVTDFISGEITSISAMLPYFLKLLNQSPIIATTPTKTNVAIDPKRIFKNIIVNFSLVNISIIFNRPYFLPCIYLKNVSLRNYCNI